MGGMGRLSWVVIPANAGINEDSLVVNQHALGPHGLPLSQE
jgi:hypothetical protein